MDYKHEMAAILSNARVPSQLLENFTKSEPPNLSPRSKKKTQQKENENPLVDALLEIRRRYSLAHFWNTDHKYVRQHIWRKRVLTKMYRNIDHRQDRYLYTMNTLSSL